MSEEKDIWQDSPSQVENFITFALLAMIFWLVLPLFLIFWIWLSTKNTNYRLTNQRLIIKSGIINKSLDELELYRVKDYMVDEPFILRMFNLGNVVLETSDRSHPYMVLRAIHNAEELRDTIRNHVEQCRDRKGVREVDFADEY